MNEFIARRLPMTAPISFHSLGRIVAQDRICFFVRSPNHDLVLTVTPARDHQGPVLAGTADFVVTYRFVARFGNRPLPGSFVEDIGRMLLKNPKGLYQLLRQGTTRDPRDNTSGETGYAFSVQTGTDRRVQVTPSRAGGKGPSFFGWSFNLARSLETVEEQGEVQLACLMFILSQSHKPVESLDAKLPSKTHTFYVDFLKDSDRSTPLPREPIPSNERVTWVFDLPSACANRCTFCAADFCRVQPVEPGETLGWVRKWVEETEACWHPDTLADVSLVGRDAAENRDILEVISYLNGLSRVRRVAATTPGTSLAQQSIVEGLEQAGLQEVTLTLIGPETTVHDTLAGRKGAFDNLVSGIENLKRSAIDVTLNIVLVKDNISVIPKTVELAVNWGLRFRFYLYVTEPFVTLEQAALNYPRMAQVTEALERLPAPSLPLLDGIYYVPDCVVPPRLREILGPQSQKQPSPPATPPAPCARCPRFKRGCPSITSHYQKLFGDGELIPLLED